MSRTSDAVALVRQFVPQFKIINKAESRFHRAIGRIFSVAGIGRDYMDSFWTTIGFTAAAPRKPSHDRWAVILHEGYHAWQAKKWTRIGLGVIYLFPQLIGILAVLAIPAICYTGWWWGLLGLLALTPIPSIGRTIVERQAYEVSMALDYWSTGNADAMKSTSYIDGWLVRNFATSNYYWMWPWKQSTRRWARAYIEKLESGRLEMTEYLVLCKALAERYRAED